MSKFKHFIILVAFVHYTGPQGIGGPFRMKITQLSYCGDGSINKYENTLNFSTRLVKKGRNKYSYSCNCSVGNILNDNGSLEIHTATFGNGGWRPNFYIRELKRICLDGWKIIGPSFETALMTTRNASSPIKCPIPAGQYPISNFIIDTRRLEKAFYVLPYGKFRVDVVFKKKLDVVGCMRLYVVVTPKK